MILQLIIIFFIFLIIYQILINYFNKSLSFSLYEGFGLLEDMQKGKRKYPNQINIQKEISTLSQFTKHIEENASLENVALLNLDLTKMAYIIESVPVKNSVFLGCKITKDTEQYLRDNNSLVFPYINNLPFNVFPSRLYTSAKLLGNNDEFDINIYDFNQSKDAEIYDWYSSIKTQSVNDDILSRFMMSTHDNMILDDLHKQINIVGENKIVGIMGGHAAKRDTQEYRNAVILARKITQKGFIVITGGGPGLMEAGNLGALLAYYPDDSVDKAIEILKKHPESENGEINDYFKSAIEVLKKYPLPKDKITSISIPTWFYEQENRTNIFTNYIAKMFSNDLREYNLINVSKGGFIVSPGKAGTLSEIFMYNNTQYYNLNNHTSPFIFENKDYWTKEVPVYPLLKKFSREKEYNKKLYALDNPDDIINKLTTNQ